MSTQDYGKYNSFICYRRSENPNAPEYASLALATCIKSIESDKDLDFLSPMMFEERAGCDYYTDVPAMMRSVRSFIVCICPAFFDRMIRLFEECNRNLETFRRIASDPAKPNIVYLEIAEALRQDNMNFFPVFVDFYNEDGVQTSAQQYLQQVTEVLFAIYGPKFASLIHRTNIPTARYVADRGGELFSKTNFLQTVKRYFKNDYVSPAEINTHLSPLVRKLRGYYLRLIEDGNDLPSRVLDFSLNETDYLAYNRIQAEYKNLYHISNAYINGVNPLKQTYSRRSDYLKFCGCGFNDVKKLCHIQENGNRYVYWPLEFYEGHGEEKSAQDVSICALCFGILLLNAYVKTDRETINRVATETQTRRDAPIDEANIKDKLQGAIDLLITLRDYKDFSWMSEWKFTDKFKNGTINQTTLSLSTLLSADFLSLEALPQELPAKERAEITYNRFLYIQGSMRWLKEQSFMLGSDGCYWGSASDENDDPIPNVTLTVFCVEAFTKFLKDINTLLTEAILSPFYAVFEAEKDSLWAYIEGAITFLLYNYAQENPYILTNRSPSKHIGDYARILRLYCDLLASEQDFPNESRVKRFLRDCESCAAEICEELLKLDNQTILHCVFTEKLLIMDGTRNYENYENCGHLICIDALIKSTVLSYNSAFNLNMRKQKISELLSAFTAENAMLWGVRYKNEEQKTHYPMYALYYYRMAVSDFYKYFF